MFRQSSKIITRLFLVISCLLAGCSSVSQSGVGLPSPGVSAAQPQHVALLLPLQGQFGPSGQAVRNGYLAAYFADKQQNPNVPTVSVVDTSNTNIRDAYSQAISNGANFIVGPLTKPEVQQLAASNITVPTLALNSLDNNQSVSGNIYFFSLSPRDEADQAAQKAWQDGHRQAIVIAPATPWGQNIANAFENRWKSQGGQIVDTLAFNSGKNLSSSIGNLLHVDKTIVSSQGFKKAMKDKVPLSQLHRQDFDVIFLVASPSQARLIRPLLKFYFVGSIPVYATSSIYTGTPSPNTDRDLDGIIFCDMPWVLPGSLPSGIATIKSRIATLWPNSYSSYSKLYAMGVDAYQLTTHLGQLSGSPQSGLNEATGALYLGPQHQIYRQLQWAQMRNGVPVLM